MMEFTAHSSAILDEGCRIGRGTRIWHFAHLMPGCVLGEECVIGQNVFIASGVTLGNRVKVQNNVSLYEGVHCEDDVFLGPSMVFTNVRNPRSAISRKHLYAPTIVRRGATIGANATIVCGNEIGAYAFVGAGAVITRPVPPFALMLGNPARQAGWVSACGYRISFDVNGAARCTECGSHYSLRNGAVHKTA